MEREPGPFDADFIGDVVGRAKVKTRHEKRMLREQAAAEARPFAHVALSAEVRLAAPVFATEERARVEGGIKALFPDALCEPSGAAELVRARARDLTRFAEILRQTRIRDAARPRLLDAVGDDGVVRFSLNKQAACAARVNFVGRTEVLGELEVELRAADPRALCEELTWIEGESDERLFGTKLHTLPPDRRRR